jgi:predicted DNA repair protein MutK
MAGASLLTLLDDIATLLDDVSVMTKVAAKKTAGLLGDDLAVNADQVTGFAAKRELPVIWAVAKGATLNKVILVPVALLLSEYASWALTPLLMLGGAFLCYEGFHKVHHKFFHHDEEEHDKKELLKAAKDPEVDMVAHEKKKIKGAIRTDFILSAEIIVLALYAITEITDDTLTLLGALIGISIIVVVGVYGLVAGIVKLDDLGLYMTKQGGILETVGEWLIKAVPVFMKGLGIVGTVAMFLVGGDILAHGIPGVGGLIHDIAHMTGPLEVVVPTVLAGLFGIVAGGLILAVITPLLKAKEAIAK